MEALTQVDVERAVLSLTTLDRALVGGAIQFGPVGLTLSPDLAFEDWQALGTTLIHLSKGHGWWLGDWWAFGEWTYGERSAQLLGPDSLEFGTFANMGSVARRFETSRRREVLSWSHHCEVASKDPPEQDRWLDLAIAEGWSSQELRTEIRKAKRLAAEVEVTGQRQVNGGSAVVVEQDALDFLASMRDESADLLLTDPPYATDVPDIRAFAESWVPVALSKVKRSGRAYICTGAYPQELAAYLSVLPGDSSLKLANVLVWTYRNTLGPSPALTYKSNWQAVFYLHGPDAPALNCPLMTEQLSVQDIAAPDGRVGDRYDEWQKPLDLAERFIRHATEPGHLVIDPFSGTGTFLISAARLGRIGLGAECDRAMLDICGKRGVTVRLAG